MEKMIKVINDNLRNVINGIKEHRIDLESTLTSIKNDMSVRVKEASSYKGDVEAARNIISSYESEIADLEHDLVELTEKFGSKNFKEILNAGNKEINSKIMEKRALINEQSQIILELTDKARNLKEILIDLREKKISTEDNLEKTKILEAYFESRIGDTIKFSEEHPDELASYRDEIPQEELNVQENIDISSIIDGSIFEEIDEISNGEPDKELIEKVLANPDEITIYEQSDNQQEPEVKESFEEETTAEKLGNMIDSAKDFIDKQNEEEDYEEDLVSEDLESTEIEENIEETELSPIIDHNGEELVSEEDEDYIDIYVDDESDESTPIDINIDESDDPFIDIQGLENELNGVNTIEEDEDVEELHIEEENIPTIEIDENTLTNQVNEIQSEMESPDNFTIEDVKLEIKDCGLDEQAFSSDDLNILRESFDKDNFNKSIEIIKNHKLDISNIYKNVRILIDITPDDLERMLTLLEQTKANSQDIDMVLRYLDKVNVDKLEQLIKSGNDSLTLTISEASNYDGHEAISYVIGLNEDNMNELKNHVDENDFRIMNILPDVVLANYYELKSLNIDNPMECFIKHPHRFTLTHSEFHEILDKYDTEDLVRCINKNTAVIDKL